MYSTLVVFILIPIVWINISLHNQPENLTEFNHENHELIHRLNFLEDQIKNRALGERMQDIFPEGFVFTNALYGLSWCEVARKVNPNSELYNRSLQEARFAYNEICSEKGKSGFNKYMTPEYGIFYQGWSNYLLANLIDIQGDGKADIKELELLKINSDKIAQAFKKSENPFIETYPGQAWPADAMVAVASLKLNNNLQYDSLISTWINKVKLHLDDFTQMIPHKVSSHDGSVIEGARGCSSSLIIRLLAQIDIDFAKEQYQKYSRYFMFSRMGLPAIREYPIGKSGLGDIDSGPVILGVGFAGTIVGIGTHQMMQQDASATKQYQTVKAFGFETTFCNKKMVLAGAMPLGDAFLTWSRLSTSQINDVRNIQHSVAFKTFTFHLISFLLISALCFPFYKSFLFKLIRKTSV